MTDRSTKILAVLLASTGTGSVRDANPHAVFARISRGVPDLEIDHLLDAADQAKRISTELRSLHHRLATAAAHQRRRAEGR